MAFAQSAVTTVRTSVAGRRYWRLTWTETGVTTATDGTADSNFKPPCRMGSIVSIKATKTSGSGATLNPRIGHTSGFVVSTQNHILTASATAAHINEQGQSYFFSPGNSLYWRSLPDAGSDNAVSVEVIVAEGAP